eukprot:1382512-Amorphochlora_amoeboformis.AAC.1
MENRLPITAYFPTEREITRNFHQSHILTDFKRVPEPEPEIKETKEDEAPIEQREDQPQVVPLENPEAKDTAAPS